MEGVLWMLMGCFVPHTLNLNICLRHHVWSSVSLSSSWLWIIDQCCLVFLCWLSRRYLQCKDCLAVIVIIVIVIMLNVIAVIAIINYPYHYHHHYDWRCRPFLWWLSSLPTMQTLLSVAVVARHSRSMSSSSLLAPTGALVLMMVNYISGSGGNFSDVEHLCLSILLQVSL